jgi:predicted transcriptional regulator
MAMTKEQIEAVLENVRSWPEEDQEELVAVARLIEAQRTGLYVMTEQERAAVREGVTQAERGEFVSDEDMEAFWKRSGAP